MFRIAKQIADAGSERTAGVSGSFAARRFELRVISGLAKEDGHEV